MRILTALLALVLLCFMAIFVLDAVKKPPAAKGGPMRIMMQPLPLDSTDPGRTRLGDLTFLGAWELTGPDRGFGGLSAIAVLPDGRIQALSDSAVTFLFDQPGGETMGEVKHLPVLKSRARGWLPGTTDSESMVVDPVAEKIWAGFEVTQMICRYRYDLSRAEACRTWPGMKGWPEVASIESMARMMDGRFLVIAEGAYGKNDMRDVLLFTGDPAEQKTPSPMLMHYVPPVGYDPTDAVAISQDKLLVLNRRATIFDGFTAIITLVDISGMKAGARLVGREVARLAPPIVADNYEGLALERKPDGQRILWVVSDDNHLFFERTLLLKFLLPENL